MCDIGTPEAQTNLTATQHPLLEALPAVSESGRNDTYVRPQDWFHPKTEPLSVGRFWHLGRGQLGISGAGCTTGDRARRAVPANRAYGEVGEEAAMLDGLNGPPPDEGSPDLHRLNYNRFYPCGSRSPLSPVPSTPSRHRG